MMKTVKNTLGTRKIPKKKDSLHPTPKKEKPRPIMSACWDFPLAA
jgi:hypothetical protein